MPAARWAKASNEGALQAAFTGQLLVFDQLLVQESDIDQHAQRHKGIRLGKEYATRTFIDILSRISAGSEQIIPLFSKRNEGL